MVREFYLENKTGNKWRLDRPETGFMAEPSGLGFSMDASYSRLGYGFVRNYLNDKQQEISANVIFGGKSPYAAYAGFVGFIGTSDGLKLSYKTDAGEYFRDVDLVELGKGELTGSHVLECPVKFKCRTMFYADANNYFSVARTEQELRYDFAWPARFNDYGSRRVSIENDGHVPASFEMTIYGYCENMEVTLVVDGQDVSKVQFPTILQEGEKILYSSVDGNLYCLRVDENGNEENFIDSLDIGNDNFFKIPVGDCQIRFSSDTGAANRTAMTMHKFFRTV